MHAGDKLRSACRTTVRQFADPPGYCDLSGNFSKLLQHLPFPNTFFAFWRYCSTSMMRSVATDGAAWSVCHNHEPCKSGWSNSDAVQEVDSGGPKEPRIRLGSRSSMWRRTNFEGDYVKIFQHSSEHRSQWPKCQDFSACCRSVLNGQLQKESRVTSNFSKEKSPHDAASRQNSLCYLTICKITQLHSVTEVRNKDISYRCERKSNWLLAC